MPFQIGSATDYIDLADKLRKFLCGYGTTGTVTYSGTGNGTLTGLDTYPAAVTETWTVTCITAAANGGTFSVVGSVTGATANATVGTPYDNGKVKFTINDGSTDFVVNDAFSIPVTAGVMDSATRWTQLAWTPGNVTTGGMSLYVRGPGAAADKRVFFQMQSLFDDTVPAYAWDMRGATAYDSALGFNSQPGVSSLTCLALWKSTISYWLYGNARRFVIVCKVNTVYLSAYCGFFLPWATPAEYPFPLFVAGSDGLLRPYNSTDSAHRFFCDPGGTSTEGSGGDYTGGKVRKQDGVWNRARNQDNGTSNDNPAGYTETLLPTVWPYSLRAGSNSNNTRSWTNLGGPSDGSSDTGAVDHLVATAQGERILLPVIILNHTEPVIGGALDGIYFPMGDGLTPEQTSTISGKTYRAFPNIHRTSGNDWFMVEEL